MMMMMMMQTSFVKCWGKSLWSLVEIWTHQKTTTW